MQVWLWCHIMSCSLQGLGQDEVHSGGMPIGINKGAPVIPGIESMQPMGPQEVLKNLLVLRNSPSLAFVHVGGANKRWFL